MTEPLTFLLVGKIKLGIQELINKFISEWGKSFEIKELPKYNSTSAQIKIYDRNIELNLVNINIHLSEYEGPKPSAVLFVYNMHEKDTFEVLNTYLQKVNELFPNIEKVLVENNSDKDVNGVPQEKEINDFIMDANPLFFRVNIKNPYTLETLFKQTIKSVLKITEKIYIINEEQRKMIFPKIEDPDQISILVVGEREAEKEKIIKAFINDDKLVGAYASKIIKFNNKNVEFNLHDASYIYSSDISLLSEHKTNSSNTPLAILLIYDITNEKTFNELKKKWYPEVKKHFPNAIKVLVGNNSEKFKMEKVSEKEANEYAKEIGASFCLVNPETKYYIDELFIDIAYKVYPALKKEKKPKGKINKSHEKGESGHELERRDAKCCCLIA